MYADAGTATDYKKWRVAAAKRLRSYEMLRNGALGSGDTLLNARQ